MDRNASPPPLVSPARAAVLREGRNCWRIVRADRAAVLVDAEAYFGHLQDVLLSARQSILILGWDFDGRIKLKPQDDDCPSLGELLRAQVEKHPDLRVDILVWSVAVWHAPSSSAELLLGQRTEDAHRGFVHRQAHDA